MLFHSEFIQNIINALNKEADIKNIGIRGHNLTKSPPASPRPLTHAHSTGTELHTHYKNLKNI